MKLLPILVVLLLTCSSLQMSRADDVFTALSDADSAVMDAQPEAAIAASKRALAMAIGQRDPAAILHCQLKLGALLLDCDRYDQALPLLTKALSTQLNDRSGQSLSLDIADTRELISRAYLDQRLFDKSANELHQALNARQEALITEDPVLVKTESDLSLVECLQHKPSLTSMRAIVGKSHRPGLRQLCSTRLALALLITGDSSGSVQEIARAASLKASQQYADNLLSSLLYLADEATLDRKNDVLLAIEINFLPIFRFYPHQSSYVTLLKNLAEHNLQLHNQAQAQRLFALLLESPKIKLPAEQLALDSAAYAALLDAAGDHARAEKLWQRSDTAYEQVTKSDHFALDDVRNPLCMHYLDGGRPDKAIALASDYIKAMQNKNVAFQKLHMAAYASSLNLLGRAYGRKGMAHLEIVYLERGIDCWQKIPGDKHTQAIWQTELGDAYMKQNMASKAKQQFESAYSILLHCHSDDLKTMAELKSRLGPIKKTERSI